LKSNNRFNRMKENNKGKESEKGKESKEEEN
jgi:hypothetical protein